MDRIELMEHWLIAGIDVAVLFVEAAGALIVTIGAVLALIKLAQGWLQRDPTCFIRARIIMGRYLALGLEFQLAGDILKTAVAPTWHDIGLVAAIAAIRTVLNYFLAQEIKELREQLRDAGAEHIAGAAPTAGARPGH
jgi:uncharacterized membrane protein